MKQTVKRIVIFMSIIIIIIAIISYSSNNIDSSEIIGQWTTIEGNDFRFLEFFSDGTYTSSHPNYFGDYSIDRDRLKLSGIMMEARTYTFEIQGDTLSLYIDNKDDTPVAVLKRDD